MTDSEIAAEWEKTPPCYQGCVNRDALLALIASVRSIERNACIERACDVLRAAGLATGHGDSVEDVVRQAIWQARGCRDSAK